MMPGPEATDEYIAGMDQAPGIFNPEKFRSEPFAQFTEDAKDVVKQLRDQYNAGQPDVVKAVKDYEGQHFQHIYTDTPGGRANAAEDMQEFGSGEKFAQSRAWDLFYQAHQRYIGSALAREDPMTPETQKALEEHQGFDMAGRPTFDFDSLIKKGLIMPRNVPDYVPKEEPKPGQIDFDKLFKLHSELDLEPDSGQKTSLSQLPHYAARTDITSDASQQTMTTNRQILDAQKARTLRSLAPPPSTPTATDWPTAQEETPYSAADELHARGMRYLDFSNMSPSFQAWYTKNKIKNDADLAQKIEDLFRKDISQ